MKKLVSRVVTLGLLSLLSSCGDGPTTPGGDSQLVLVGFLEVGMPVEARIVRGINTTVVAHSGLTFSPADAATLSTTDNSFTFKVIGTVVVTARDSIGPVTTTVTVNPTPTILFDMNVGGNRDVYRATILGTDVLRVTSNSAVDAQPTSAHGIVVYTSYRDGNGELYSHDLNSPSTPDMRLSTTAANETDAALSPDGLRLMLTRDDGNTPRLYVTDMNNFAPFPMTPAGGAAIEGKPSWRFSSDSILFMSTTLGNPSIFRDARLTNSTPVTAARPLTSDSVYTEPSWSLDGRFIAYSAAAIGGSSRVAVRDRTTGIAVYITPAGASAGHPVFLADGRLVVTMFASNGSTSLGLVDPAVPNVVVPIPLTGTDPQNPAIIWP